MSQRGAATMQDQESALDSLRAGQDALARGAWLDARLALEASVAAAEDLAEAWELLGLAAFWMEDARCAIEARERAFRLYRARDDATAAARVAIGLADDYYTFRNQRRVANGWLLRARRLLEAAPVSDEHGLLACQSGFIALMADHDAAAAGRFGAEAADIGRQLRATDIEMYGIALEGLSLVSRGDAGAGMALLDEATAAATGGEVADPSIAGAICCNLIFACEWVRDYPRAAEWCERVQALCEHYQLTSLLAVCQTHFAGVLTSMGEWNRAEAILERCSAELAGNRPAFHAEALARLAELRRREGRLQEAADLFERSNSHPLAIAGAAALALELGDAPRALHCAERALRRMPQEARIERADCLATLALARLRTGDRAGADSAAQELFAIASQTGTPFLAALAHSVRGHLEFERGELRRTAQAFEDAQDGYQQCGAPFEAARAGLDLARVLAALGDTVSAASERARAEGALRSLGRVREHPDAGGEPHRAPAGLTRRELEVLGHLARGLSNPEIASQLVLSLRTVERHISTIYNKVGADGPAARVMASSFARQHGIP